MLFRRRPSEVAAWPAWEVRLLEQYLAKQPAAEDRIEIAIAGLRATYINAHKREGDALVQPFDFLPYLKPWPIEPTESSSEFAVANRGWLKAFRSLSSRIKK